MSILTLRQYMIVGMHGLTLTLTLTLNPTLLLPLNLTLPLCKTEPKLQNASLTLP